MVYWGPTTRARGRRDRAARAHLAALGGGGAIITGCRGLTLYAPARMAGAVMIQTAQDGSNSYAPARKAGEIPVAIVSWPMGC
jgi:hypothetical protein